MMKTHCKTLFVMFLAAIAFAFIPPKHRLTGKWTVFSPDGSSIGEVVELKSDGTYTVSLPNGDIGERGFYKLERDVFSLKNAKDYVCGANYWGKYKLEFHGDDSIHFTLIQDSCKARVADIVGYNPGLRRKK